MTTFQNLLLHQHQAKPILAMSQIAFPAQSWTEKQEQAVKDQQTPDVAGFMVFLQALCRE
jgi:hypothetical protein